MEGGVFATVDQSKRKIGRVPAFLRVVERMADSSISPNHLVHRESFSSSASHAIVRQRFLHHTPRMVAYISSTRRTPHRHLDFGPLTHASLCLRDELDDVALLTIWKVDGVSRGCNLCVYL